MNNMENGFKNIISKLDGKKQIFKINHSNDVLVVTSGGKETRIEHKPDQTIPSTPQPSNPTADTNPVQSDSQIPIPDSVPTPSVHVIPRSPFQED